MVSACVHTTPPADVPVAVAIPELPADAAAVYLADHYGLIGAGRNDFRNANLNRLIASLVRGSSVLDIGSGSGRLLALLAEHCDEVCGLEPNPKLVTLSRELHPEATVFQGTGEAVDHLGRKFDAITIIDVLEHIEDDRTQLRRIFEALRPGGRLVILVPAFPCLFGKRDRQNGHFRRYTRKELVGKLREAGFVVQRVRFWNALGFVPYWIAERVIHAPLDRDLRSDRAKNIFKRGLIRGLHLWYKHVENRWSLGLGLSLICEAVRKENMRGPE